MGDTGSAQAGAGLTQGQKERVTAAAGFVPAASGAIGLLSGLSQQNRLNKQADSVKDANAIEVARLARQQRRQMGTLKASMGARGVITTSGTPLMVLADQASEAALERSILRHQGQIEAFGLREQGKSAMLSGVGSLLGGVGTGVITSMKVGSELGTFGQSPMSGKDWTTTAEDFGVGPQGF